MVSAKLELCKKVTANSVCLKARGHSARCDAQPSLWNNIEMDAEKRTKKKIIKAGFATPRGGDKGGYQNHVSRSSRVIIPFEHSENIDFSNYAQGAVVRVTAPQALVLLQNGNLREVQDYFEVNIAGTWQRAFLLYRSERDLASLPPRQGWLPCGHRIKGLESNRRSATGQDFGHYLARIPRGRSEGIQQGIFAPEYAGKEENYACQILLTYLSYKTIGHVPDKNLDHVELVLLELGLLDTETMKLKGLINDSGETACPLCTRPIEYAELHEAIDPSQVPGLANSGVQLAETRSTLVNLFHLKPLLYSTELGHTSANIAWGHAHCNTFLSQRRSFSLKELAITGEKVTEDLYWDATKSFIRSSDNRAWVSVTPLEPGTEAFSAYLLEVGAAAALVHDDDGETSD